MRSNLVAECGALTCLILLYMNNVYWTVTSKTVTKFRLHSLIKLKIFSQSDCEPQKLFRIAIATSLRTADRRRADREKSKEKAENQTEKPRKPGQKARAELMKHVVELTSSGSAVELNAVHTHKAKSPVEGYGEGKL